MFKAFQIPNKLIKWRNVRQILQTRHKSNDVRVFINGKAIKVPPYYTIMQALKSQNVTIPSFCYHDRLSIAGNCRVCLVEVEGWGKPQVACASPVGKDMRIRTNSDVACKAQESVLEFILVDHPLDCPICDQGGECDLQDLSVRYGNDRSRFTDIHFEGKRAVESKFLSPLIRGNMNRCIHCTRCIRFGSQVCGLDVLGSTGRGHDMLVGTFVPKLFLSELSGNIVDLCPVGALTNVPYRYKARSWELKKANSIDVTDAVGTNIILNYRFDRVLRVLPRENDEINQEYVSDKGRWAIDSLEMQRLVTPMLKIDSCCCLLEWDCALKKACEMIKAECPSDIMVIAGPYTNVETLVASKDVLNMIGCEMFYVERGLSYSSCVADIRASYCLTTPMKNIPQADVIILIGTNPRFEAPILNMWIRQAYRNNECDIFVIGPKCDYNYHVTYLSEEMSGLALIHKTLTAAKNPLIFIGIAALEGEAAPTIMKAVNKAIKGAKKTPNNIINIVTREASYAGALEAGWRPGGNQAVEHKNPKLIISLGADEIFYKWKPPKSTKVIYVGFQGDVGAECASLILPGSAYSEAGGLFLNMEGRSQFAYPAVTPPGKARHDWKIFRALAEYLHLSLFYSDHSSLCTRMAQISPNFTCLGMYQRKLFEPLIGDLVVDQSAASKPLCVDMKKMKDYYCSDVFTYNSPTMIKTQRAAVEFEESKYYPD